jgi:hypothetical protein
MKMKKKKRKYILTVLVKDKSYASAVNEHIGL